MNGKALSCTIGAAALAFLLQATPAEAQLFRTWVAGNGNDGNTCSRSQPCATFTGALAKTNANGEINCVDAGQYGAVIIAKPITIDCGGNFAGLGSGVVEILIKIEISEASFPNAIVRLRNLALNAGGSVANVILVRGGGAEVHIENCSIAGAGGAAVSFAPEASLDLFIRDTFITGSGSTGFNTQPSNTSALARVSLNNVRLDHNRNGVGAFRTSPGNVFVMLEDVQIENSTDTAITADGVGAFVFMSGSTVTLNGAAFSASNGGQIFSFGNNSVAANASVGSTPTPLQQQ